MNIYDCAAYLRILLNYLVAVILFCFDDDDDKLTAFESINWLGRLI